MGSLLTLEVLSPDSLLGQWVPHLLALLSFLPPHAQGTNVQGHYSAFYAGAGDPKVLMFAQQTRYCLNHLPSPQLDHSLLGTLSYVCVWGGGGVWWQASMAFIYFSPLPVITAQCLLGRKLLRTVPLLFCEKLGGGAGTKRANLVPLSLPLTEALLPLSR